MAQVLGFGILDDINVFVVVIERAQFVLFGPFKLVLHGVQDIQHPQVDFVDVSVVVHEQHVFVGHLGEVAAEFVVVVVLLVHLEISVEALQLRIDFDVRVRQQVHQVVLIPHGHVPVHFEGVVHQ